MAANIDKDLSTKIIQKLTQDLTSYRTQLKDKKAHVEWLAKRGEAIEEPMKELSQLQKLLQQTEASEYYHKTYLNTPLTELLAKLDTFIKEVETRFTTLETDVTSGFEEVNTALTALTSRVATLESYYGGSSGGTVTSPPTTP